MSDHRTTTVRSAIVLTRRPPRFLIQPGRLPVADAERYLLGNRGATPKFISLSDSGDQRNSIFQVNVPHLLGLILGIRSIVVGLHPDKRR